MEPGKTYAVAIAYPMQGHINPMLHLCKRLSLLGISIALVNTEANHTRLLQSRGRAGVGSLKDQGFDIELVAISDGLAPGDSSHEGGPDEAIQLSLIAAEKMQTPFQQLLQSYMDSNIKVSCIIADAFLGWAQDVAEEFSIPRVALWASSAAYFLLNYHLPLLSEKGYAPIKDRKLLQEDAALIDFIPGLHPLHAKDLPSILQQESPSDPGFSKRAARAKRLKDAAWVVINTFDALEHQSLEVMQQLIGKCAAVGPLLPSALMGGDILDTGAGGGLWEDDDRCLQWLNQRSPASVIFIAFGSLAQLSVIEMMNLAEGIEASQQPFLWAIRPNLVSQNFKDDYISGFIKRTGHRGLIVDWAPQLQILFHPSIGGFLSHCGWNSTLESIAMGVPIIGMPCIAEQNLNCKHVAMDWKVGTRLKKNDDGFVSKEEVERVIMRFMTGQEGMELRIRVGKLREAARMTVNAGGSSHASLEALVRDLNDGHVSNVHVKSG